MSFGLEPYLRGKAAERKDSITGLNADFVQSLYKLYDAAPDDIRKNLRINSAYRSFAYQKELYDKAIREHGTANKPGHQVAKPDKNAPHIRGQAVDISQIVSPQAARWLHANAAKHGFHFPVPGEPWHMELTPAAQEEIRREKRIRSTPFGRPDYMGDNFSKKPKAVVPSSPELPPSAMAYSLSSSAAKRAEPHAQSAKTSIMDASFWSPETYSYKLPTSLIAPAISDNSHGMTGPADERVFSCGAAGRDQRAHREAGARQRPVPMPGNGQCVCDHERVSKNDGNDDERRRCEQGLRDARRGEGNVRVECGAEAHHFYDARAANAAAERYARPGDLL